MEAALNNSSLGRIALGMTAIRIGRGRDNGLVLSDSQASTHHAEIAPGPGGNSYQITDLNSTNGTFVNEQRLIPNAPRPLNPGDMVRIGTTSFAYEVVGAGYTPTEAVGSANVEATMVAMPDPQGQPAFPAPPAYTPPPAAYGQPNYPQPQANYQQQPGAYGQPNYPQPQAAYPQQPGAYGQPGYPQPGIPGQPVRKRSRAGLWITLVIILLLVVVGVGGAFYYFQIRSTPAKTLQAYCTALQNNDAQGLYNTLSTEDTELLIGGIKSCTVNSNSIQESGSTATGGITLVPDQGRAASGTIHLVDENNQWKINDTTDTP
jgi:hypothetical protein